LSRAASQGGDVRVLYVTDGSASHIRSKRFPPATVARIREREAANALRAIGIRRPPLYLRAPDGALAALPKPETTRLVTMIASVVRDIRPARRVFTVVPGSVCRSCRDRASGRARAASGRVSPTGAHVRRLVGDIRYGRSPARRASHCGGPNEFERSRSGVEAESDLGTRLSNDPAHRRRPGLLPHRPGIARQVAARLGFRFSFNGVRLDADDVIGGPNSSRFRLPYSFATSKSIRVHRSRMRPRCVSRRPPFFAQSRYVTPRSRPRLEPLRSGAARPFYAPQYGGARYLQIVLPDPQLVSAARRSGEIGVGKRACQPIRAVKHR